MFNNLVESTSNARNNAKQSAYFGITAVVYGSLFAAILVWSIFSFDLSAVSANDNLSLNSLVAPVPVPENAPPAPEVSRPQKSAVEENSQKSYDTLKDPVADINRVAEPPKTVSTVNHNNDVVRENVAFVPGTITRRAVSDGTFSPDRESANSSAPTGIVPKNSKTDEPNEIEPPPVVKSSPERIQPSVKMVSKGVITGLATALPKPSYPPSARIAGVGGAVSVQVVIDETGKVISAAAVSGPPLLRASAAAAARQARFTPTKLSDQPVKVTGIIVYNFVQQ